jgi:hypothetical protein
MSDSPAMGFGGFLVGLGVGWYVFTTLEITGNLFAWLIILCGAAIVLSSLLKWGQRDRGLGGIVGGVIGGLILSLFITTGFGFIDVFDGGSLGTYRAETTETFTNTMTAESVYLFVDNFNGPISVSTWDKKEYRIDLTIKAKGTTTSEAEKNLEKFDITFSDVVVAGQERLNLDYSIAPTEMRKYSVKVDVFLPADAVIDLDLESSNGGISLKDIVGGEIRLDTSNGAYTFENVYSDSINAETSNGAIKGNFESPDTFISTSNGEIDLILPCTVTGDYDLRTSNGAVDIKVSSSSVVGYDLDVSTSNGGISISLPNLDYSQDQRTSKEARTLGFMDKAVKITIKVSTSNGSVAILD